MSDKWTGWIQLVMAGVAAFSQIWQLVHTGSLDAGHSAVAAALAAGGIHHITK